MKKLLQDRKTLYLVLCIAIVSVFTLSIAFAAMSTVLEIHGNSEVVASNWDIHLENPVVKSGSVHNNLPTINGNSLSFNATLSLPGDYYEFDVDVANDGSIDAMIDSVSISPELTTVQAKYIKYEVSYQNGESISSKQTLMKGTSTSIRVRIEYRNDISSSDLPSTETNLSLKVTLLYVQSDGTGGEINNNGVKVKTVDIVSGDGTQVGDELCIGEECFYVISSDDTSVTMLSKYNLYVGYSHYRDETDPLEPEWMYDDLEYSVVKQSSKAIGRFDGFSVDNPAIGVTNYTTYINLDNIVSDVFDENSILYGYVMDYKSYLESFDILIADARIMRVSDLNSLGCKDGSCENAPSWVYSTAYWTSTLGENMSETLWTVSLQGRYLKTVYYDMESSGVRPVITISRDYL